MYRISVEPAYLLAELLDRETERDTQEFLGAVVRANARHGRSCVLILERLSTPVFQVAAHRLLEHFYELSATGARRVGLVGDTLDLHMSHEYIELLAGQRGLNVRGFRHAAAALRWLTDRRRPEERRQRRLGRDGRQERRRQDQRRGHERRASAGLSQSAR